MATRPNNLICFQLVEHSSCPTTTVATYVQHATNIEIEQLLQCIQSNDATQFIAIILTILEFLTKNIQTQKYLFRSDHLLHVIQTWLSLAILPSIVFSSHSIASRYWLFKIQ